MTVANTIVTSGLVVDHETDAGTVHALAHSGLVVEGGASVAIMGPSGCGKSTLLGLVAGLALPTRGTVTVGDTLVSSLSERERIRFRRRSVGMVYQADNLLPHLTVEENVALQLALSAAGTGGDRSGRPGRVLDQLGLGELATRLPDQLSGGQRQRVAVARAVVHRPAIVLADEPTGALDDTNAHLVIDLLVGLQREIGATLLIVTHDPAIADRTERIVELTRPAATLELVDAD